ncbi:roadblock/LC7 domain-containing protein [Streptomyces sp. ISL-12]|uniref:roadblock/LC7 domain-containing protein n=1 Tax=Streptomyces sp. ISL-12 TaxID=2819177 RepID=UPI001BE5D297|nr:roadblock/LC7 domain-containing protein [Streptomyces sp. ISL-12]MBT2412062.1 roadblock/LC7 domain-containing protein [Streptomyces sp. ISL-12]
MTTSPDTNHLAAGHTPSATAPSSPLERLASFLQHFAADTSGVTHAVLLSRDGIRLVDSEVDKDWADELAAAISGMASIAANITGPTRAKRPARQIIVERDDCLLFVQNAGRSTAFPNQPGNVRGVVDTVLAVITTADADAGTVGYEMGRLVERFAPYMDIPVRTAPGVAR